MSILKLIFLCTVQVFLAATAVSASSSDLPFTLGIRDSIMIAHSFHDNPAFGPAGKLHGATYTCDVEFKCKSLTPTLNWVMDIGKASDLLSRVLSKYNLKNLDEIFPDKTLTTTEFMARQIHRDLVELLLKECVEIGDSSGSSGSNDQACSSDSKLEGKILVKLWESHKAWASYEAAIE
mmetsp:Transcript_16346/g.24517  ORF Transcript_16346/g.24517 Transcript_16346/m.24517 type:complete len:179 (+) Transcript_16346:104-640(+)|eukprot:CAMPEP_0203642702 /NCGR_PEP_ID=MMETSP0088-20131115/8101_1 /ASSEMBLY_ACC=CAM_ASM_001087 /TAXON_ID=426623 /ORGANISM="Chaetoceros affinis, Strain CCMP159" /LENGTH=178 /DNA_ID=CAMNT_0050498615 /DNA_START=53 /DNA_END=589 /DNA_ORIENTATION=-